MRKRTGVKYARQKERERPSMKMDRRMTLHAERFEVDMLSERLRGKLSKEKIKEARRLMANVLKSLKKANKSLKGIQEKHDMDIVEYAVYFEKQMASRTAKEKKLELALQYQAHLLNVFEHYEMQFLLYDFLAGEKKSKLKAEDLKEFEDMTAAANDHMEYVGDLAGHVGSHVRRLETK
jgi:hypothetical protein